MTATEIKTEFDAIATKLRATGNAEAAARAEVLREWFTNEAFRKNLADFSFAATK